MIYYHIFRDKEFSVFLHVNNPGHWMENYEVWAAPGHQTTVASHNGYVRDPWRRIANCHMYLHSRIITEETKDILSAAILDKFGWDETNNGEWANALHLLADCIDELAGTAPDSSPAA